MNDFLLYLSKFLLKNQTVNWLVVVFSIIAFLGGCNLGRITRPEPFKYRYWYNQGYEDCLKEKKQKRFPVLRRFGEESSYRSDETLGSKDATLE